MLEKIYLNLLLLCGIFFQGIIGTLTDDNIGESADILVRQKRVVSHVPGEDKKEVIRSFPYLVNIKYNNRISCVGSILSHHVVITIPSCVTDDVHHYLVFSKTGRTDSGNIHNVLDIKRYYGGHLYRQVGGIALLTVAQPFVYGQSCFYIELHSGPLLPGMLGTVAGWGYNVRSNDHGTRYPTGLRSIKVPIVSHRDCVNRYQPHNIEVLDNQICTYHPQKHCGHNDGGAPLVIDGELVGVHLWAGPEKTPSDPQYPDVYALLQHSDYNQWIRTNIREIEAQIENRQK